MVLGKILNLLWQNVEPTWGKILTAYFGQNLSVCLVFGKNFEPPTLAKFFCCFSLLSRFSLVTLCSL